MRRRIFSLIGDLMSENEMERDKAEETRAHYLAVLAIDNGEGGAQIEIKDEWLRESLILNVEKQMKRGIKEAITVSEKRAEEIERERDRWFMVMLGTFADLGVPTPEKAREQFTPELASSEVRRIAYKCDEARASLVRVREALTNLMRAGATEIIIHGAGCTAGYLEAEDKAKDALREKS